jgi:hypothetical protein
MSSRPFIKAAFHLGVAVFILQSEPASADPNLQLQGSLYKLGSNRKEKIYTWKMKACSDLWISTYSRLDGTPVVEEVTRFDGGRFAGYSYVRHTTGERSSVQVTGMQLRFDYEVGDKIESKVRVTGDTFLAGPAVFAFIQEHLRELTKGKEFQFKYGVLDQLDYFTFKLSSERPSSPDTFQIKISPTSPFVRMAVDPIHVTLSKNGRFRSVTGRTIIIEKDGRRLVPIDADLVVESEVPASCHPNPRHEGSTFGESGPP